MSTPGRHDLLVPKHINPESVSFSVFTAEELKKICVQKVVSPFILDTLGHPLPGGLYDKNLGPLSEKSEPCGTCNKNIYECSGHFAYIELPLPVVNPVFHKIIGQILKISCLSCFKIQLREEARKKLETNKEDVIESGVLKAVLNEIKTEQACIFCRVHIEKIQPLRNRIILVRRKTDINTSPNKTSVMAQKVRSLESQYVTPHVSRECLRQIWKNEEDLIRLMVPVLNDVKAVHPTDALFFEVIPVPPPNVRPVNMLGDDRMIEHPQTQAYKNIMLNISLLSTIIKVVQNKGDETCLPSIEAKQAYNAARGKQPVEKMNFCWEEIQDDVNGLLDKDSVRFRDAMGLKQLIEKKSGIIRMHMMGKRVNFAARSVITPDPNLNIDEIGIPEKFAKHLTYPVPVTPWNVEEMRKLIMNGPNVHPGAVLVELEDGTVKKINPNCPIQQESLLKILLTPHDRGRRGFQGVKIVYRHLMNGDVLLLNRQPTLHKPSIMAHKARILKGEKTLRLHYANCKAYNADFDGDEMNAHFPQNELARSEGYNIANVANQYLVPKDGTPLSGLIQDHMIAGVRLSLRGRFFNKYDYHQLVYQALSFKTGRIQLLRPAILKPVPLWSGKQIMSTVIINIIPAGREAINLTASSKISGKAWQTEKERIWQAGGTPFKTPDAMSEAEVIIRGGELLVGILDKTHYGATPYGLIHCMYELYGGTYAIRLLSSFAKLFTRFLQQEGFTLGVHDILTVPSADKKRKHTITESRKIGKKVITTALNLPESTSLPDIVAKIEELSATEPKLRQIIDRQYKSALDSYTNDINKACLPAGLVCKFPHNNLQLMVQSGAKGSTVNTMQISCLLGQIELEGKRPPVMISGKSLPSFPVFEFTPRAGGFIDGRFMTGIQPQEFFFHCMAGREGLIDTAVKTSRSGYLQRCLIKHLEGLHVGYDMTVRNSDQKVIQFLYGEDGMDISRAQFLNKKQLPFLAENRKALIQKEVIDQLTKDDDHKNLESYQKKVNDWREKFGDPLKQPRKSPFVVFSSHVKSKIGDKKVKKKHYVKLWQDCDDETKNEFIHNLCEKTPDPVNSVFQSDHYFGSLNESMAKLMDDYGKDKKKKFKKEFESMWKLKNMQSLCSPGEPVGLLAAQSIGEPSTQMTLNTFHFAGRGEMNVTLGIPRLREILMMASSNIKTPSMEIPFLDVPDLEARADFLRKKLTKVVVAEVLENVEVTAKLELEPVRQHKYTLKFNFLPKECYEDDFIVTPRTIIKHMKNKFFRHMFTAITKHSKIKANLVSMEEEPKHKARANNDDDDDEPEDRPSAKSKGATVPGQAEEDSSEDEVEDQEDAKQTHKYDDLHDGQEPSEEENEASENEDEPEAESKESAENGEGQKHQEVLDKYNHAEVYKQDKKYLWCELTFVLPLNYKKLDMTAILRDVAAKSVIWETPQIKRAITYMKDDKLTVRTDGINIVEMFQYNTLLDLEKLYCNDIHKIAETYGIEAASKVIVKEVKDVFNVYGIKVDPRHLSLIADYMTFNGSFEPMSRTGMAKSSSPLQQMAFEASLNFLKEATTRGKTDDLQNPSSCLMIGKPCNVGTGCFTLLDKIPSSITVG